MICCLFVPNGLVAACYFETTVFDVCFVVACCGLFELVCGLL